MRSCGRREQTRHRRQNGEDPHSDGPTARNARCFRAVRHLGGGQGARLAAPSALAWDHGTSIGSRTPSGVEWLRGRPPFTDRALFQAPYRRSEPQNRTPPIPTDVNPSESAAFLLVGETGFEPATPWSRRAAWSIPTVCHVAHGLLPARNHSDRAQARPAQRARSVRKASWFPAPFRRARTHPSCERRTRVLYHERARLAPLTGCPSMPSVGRPQQLPALRGRAVGFT